MEPIECTLRVIEEVREMILEDANDSPELDHLVATISRWLKSHYAP